MVDGLHGRGQQISQMKVLVVGYGSIGRRHVGNLLKLSDVSNITVCTKIKTSIKNLDNSDRVQFIDSLSQFAPSSPQHFDFSIIANETYKHIETAILLAEKGINLFIEKPISHNLEKIKILEDIVKKREIIVFIGYNLRFLGAIQYIKEELIKGTIGDLYFVKIEVGHYLPLWRPWRGYRSSYSAVKAMGGGAALDLSHEIDYMRYLFGDPCYWRVIKTKVSSLEIDSDDIFEGIYMYRNNFICNVHMDYLQSDKRREIRIVGSKGSLICDFVKGEIRITIGGDERTVIDNRDMFDLNRTYMDELLHFIEAVKDNTKPRITLDDGIGALRLLEDGNV